MATCTCLLQFAFVVPTANMDQRKLEIPFILEANIPKILDVIASIQMTLKDPHFLIFTFLCPPSHTESDLICVTNKI